MKKKSNQFFCRHKLDPSEDECQFGFIGHMQNCNDCEHNNDCNYCIKKNTSKQPVLGICEICDNDKKTNCSEG